MSRVSKPIDPRLFHISSTSIHDVETRITRIITLCSKANILEVVQGLFKASGFRVTAIFLAYADAHHHGWLVDHFPSDPAHYLSSVFPQLLAELADYFAFNELDGVESRAVAAYRRSIQMGPELLDTLLSLVFPEVDPLASIEFEDEDDEPEPIVIRKAKASSQRKKKQAKKFEKSVVAVDDKLFRAWGIPMPTSNKEAGNVAITVLQDLKDITKELLDIIGLPVVAEALRQSFTDPDSIERDGSVPENSASTGRTGSSHGAQDTVSSKPSLPVAYPFVQPLKSALHFETIEGFGNWRIIISGRADHDLRESRKKDKQSFKIIIKKIKELSRGHFSDDNQKRLNGSGPEVPIFEAKMTRDSRLVYQVDCIEDLDGAVEVQVIRIFGIYTHAQMRHGGFWDSLAHLVGKKGKEYRLRCAYRLPQANAVNTFEPASFPSREELEEETTNPLELPKEDLDELHSLLILGKFITFSRPVLNSILADLDATFPFDLSSREMKIIEHASSCYVLGRSGTGKTTTMLFKMICVEASHETLQANSHKPKQLFVTQSRMLATKVSEYFTKLTSSLELASQTPQQLVRKSKEAAMTHDNAMVDREEEAIDTSNLPRTYSALRDEHFPLFITFSQLCDLLEADYADKDEMQRTGKFVTYDRFLQEYWAHFPQKLTKRLDPALFFSEMMGVIKGSEKSLTCDDGSLSLTSYKDLGHRAFSTFADNRETVYELFLAYNKQKRNNGDFDSADRTHAILSAMRYHGVPGTKIDFLYVDEVQDNLLIDTLVLRSICSNPNGLFWAGDTAQTISVGSSFKFNELKSFLFRIEETRRLEGLPATDQPKLFQLAINYRSHGGIVNCAHSVVKLITRFWPDSIDTLQPEQGVIDGGKPVFFNGWDKDTVRYEQFLFGSSGEPLEFGAHQCIIVRDEQAKIRLREQVGDIGIVMTIYESKGLEFNDVLLYNFFEDSTVDISKWRVVLNALEGQPAPDIEARHVSICTELKCLYVSITRARKNVWIADSSDKGEPMRLFWSHHSLIQNCTPNDVPRLAVESSKDEWAQQGRTLFENRRFFQAKHCFERASMPKEARVAEAYFLREQARKLPVDRAHKSAVVERNSAHLIAAKGFLECALDPPESGSATQYYLNAANCFETGGELHDAARCYLHAGEYTTSCKLYRRIGEFSEAVAIIKKHGGRMEGAVVQNILDVSRLYFFTRHDLDCIFGTHPCNDESCSLFGKSKDLLFTSPDEQLEYLEDRDLDVARAKYMAMIPGKLAEAAEIHLAEGRALDAIRLFLDDKLSPSSLRRGGESLLQGLWRHMSFNTAAQDVNPERDALLDFLSSFDSSMLSTEEQLELSMFPLILQHSTQPSLDATRNLLRVSAELFRMNRRAGALLCLDHCFTQGSYSFEKLKADELCALLSHFLRYAQLLHEVVLDRDPCRHHGVQRMFGMSASNENVVYLRHSTFLGTFLLQAQGRVPVLQVAEDGVFISTAILSQILKDVLRKRLADRIRDQEGLCAKAQSMNPCVHYAAYSSCKRPNCPEDHLNPGSLSKQSYNTRVRMHLLQISIVNILFAVDPYQEQTSLKGRWIGRLYETLHPAHHALGTVSAIDKALIFTAEELLSTARGWIRSLVYNQHHTSYPTFITNMMRNFSLAFLLDRPEAEVYVYRTRRLLEGVDLLPPNLKRSAGVGFQEPIVVDYIRCLHRKSPVSVFSGIMFLRNVHQGQLLVQGSTLCDYIELLCATVIVWNKFTRQNSLHGAILPIDWLGRALQNKIWDVPPQRKLQFYLLAETVVALLEPLLAREGVIYGASHNICIIRICRALCFLGWNIRVDLLHQMIFKGITGLRREGQQLPFMLNSYAIAQDWEHLLRVLKLSIKSQSMEEVIQLVTANGPNLPSYANVRRFNHRTGGELLALVNPSKLYPLSRLSSGAMVFKPSRPTSAPQNAPNTQPTVSNSTARIASQAPEPDAAHLVEPNEENSYDPAHDLQTASANVERGEEAETTVHDTEEPVVMDDEELIEEQGSSQYVVNTEEEVQAVRVLQAAVRKWMTHRRKASKDGSDESLHHFFKAHSTFSTKKDWTCRRHRMMFLGPLIHIRLCLEALHTFTRTLKGKTKARLQAAQHEELDSLGPRLTIISQTFRAIQQRQRDLDPTNITKPHETLTSLKTLVAECETLVLTFGQHVVVPQEVLMQLELGVKGILKEPPPPPPKTKKPKPDLMLDDDFDYMDEDYEEDYEDQSDTTSEDKRLESDIS